MLGRINWHPSRRDLRYFAVTLAVVVLLLASILLLGGKYQTAVWFASVGLLMSALCYLVPFFGKVIYLPWMAITYVLGSIVSPVVTAIIFYLLVSPIGLINRLTGKDRLRLKKPKDANTYFVDYVEPQDAESMRRQF